MSTSAKKIVLVTGGNSGIGFELCAQLLEKGTYHVLMASRSVSKGEAALKDLQARNHPGTVELVELDVTKDSTITAAVQHIQSTHGYLDILVNNAGIGGPEEPLRERMTEAFAANATGPAVLTDALAALLRAASPPARIVHVSTGGASIALRLERGLGRDIKHMAYRTSKAAQCMVAANQAVEFDDAGIKVFLYSPGFTESNLGPRNKVEHGAKPVEVATKPLVGIIDGERDGEAEKNLTADGFHAW